MKIDCASLLRMTKSEAVRAINKKGFIYFIAREDSQHFNKSMDLRRNRVNLEIDRGRVTKAWIG